MAKVAAWLAVHLIVLAVAFFLFVGWQLRLGLDSLLTGATGERLESLGNEISGELLEKDESEWDSTVADLVSQYGLQAYIRRVTDLAPGNLETEVPGDIIEKVKNERPPAPPGRRMSPPSPPPGVDGDGGRRPPPFSRGEKKEAEVLFLAKDEARGDYWAAIELQLSEPRPGGAPHGLLFLKSETASANGLFFDYRPWLFGGLAVLALSIVMWAPFVLGITRYAGRISKATKNIADGKFDTKIGARRNDELGRAGDSIEEMSAQLGMLISGQKRFLGDVAHELCAPLARMRTGLGILQNTAEGKEAQRLESIDEDAEELSTLVAELLAFTKANSSAVNIETIALGGLIADLTGRELGGHEVEMRIPEGLSVEADRRFLTRALLNILRNCHRHAGENCGVRVSAKSSGNSVELTIEDDGPGAPSEELSRLFEPFYRPDRSRTRDTGGTGLGMAIVESSVRACGGKVSASRSKMGGLLVRISLPGSPASPPLRPPRK